MKIKWTVNKTTGTTNISEDELKGLNAEQRAWYIEDEILYDFQQQVWAEYEKSHDQLRSAVEMMPLEKWEGDMLYPWSERGTVERLIRIMMNHEGIDHCDVVLGAAAE